MKKKNVPPNLISFTLSAGNQWASETGDFMLREFLIFFTPLSICIFRVTVH